MRAAAWQSMGLTTTCSRLNGSGTRQRRLRGQRAELMRCGATDEGLTCRQGESMSSHGQVHDCHAVALDGKPLRLAELPGKVLWSRQGVLVPFELAWHLT